MNRWTLKCHPPLFHSPPFRSPNLRNDLNSCKLNQAYGRERSEKHRGPVFPGPPGTHIFAHNEVKLLLRQSDMPLVCCCFMLPYVVLIAMFALRLHVLNHRTGSWNRGGLCCSASRGDCWWKEPLATRQPLHTTTTTATTTTTTNNNNNENNDNNNDNNNNIIVNDNDNIE